MLGHQPSHPRSHSVFVRAEFVGNESALASATRCQPRPLVPEGTVHALTLPVAAQESLCTWPSTCGEAARVGRHGSSLQVCPWCPHRVGTFPLHSLSSNRTGTYTCLARTLGPDFSGRFRLHVKIKGTHGTSLVVRSGYRGARRQPRPQHTHGPHGKDLRARPRA